MAGGAVGGRNITDAQLTVMQRQVEADKLKILESKDILESEKLKILSEIQQRADELGNERRARDELASKLQQLQDKLLVGGINLLDKSEEQESLLQKKEAEMEAQRQKELILQRELDKREEEAFKIEGEYHSLKEEAESKTKKLKKLWTILMQHKSEIKDIQDEWMREKETLLDTIRDLSRDLKLKIMITNSYVPTHELGVLETVSEFDESTERWRIPGVQFAGNNIKNKKNGNFHRNFEDDEFDNWDPLCVFGDVYLNYDVSLRRSSRRSIAGGNRPSTSLRVDMNNRYLQSANVALVEEIQENSDSTNSASKKTLSKRSKEQVQTPTARGLAEQKKRYA